MTNSVSQVYSGGNGAQITMIICGVALVLALAAIGVAIVAKRKGKYVKVGQDGCQAAENVI